MFLIRVFAVLALTFSSVANTSTASDSVFGPDSIRIVEVEILDNATDGCWTNISTVKTYAEDQLRLNKYELTGLYPNNNLHADDEVQRIMEPVNNLPRRINKSAANAIRNHVYFDNLYFLQVYVNAKRHKTYKCWGNIEIRLSRQVTDHEMGFHTVPFVELGSTFVSQPNVNTEMFDLVKDFVIYMKEYQP